MSVLVMSRRGTLRKQAQPYLRPGETLQQVFAGEVVSQRPIKGTRAVLNTSKFRQRTFAVTPERILVLDKKGIVAELPRSTHFIPEGGLRGLVVFTTRFTYGETITIRRVFFEDVLATEGREGEPHQMWRRRSA